MAEQRIKNKAVNKVLLIQPPAFVLKDKSDMNPNVPLGIAYVAATLEKSGYQVKIIDAFLEGLEQEYLYDNERVLIGLNREQIEREIKDFAPDVVGISSLFTMQRKNAHMVCEIVKNVSEQIIVIMGGAHPTAEPELVLKDKNVDYVVLGEGEMVMGGLLQRLDQRKDVSNIGGLAFRDGDKIIVNRNREFIKDLDALPFPARHLLPMHKYFQFKKSHGINKKSPYASIVTSRGCPFGCTFCSTHTVWGKKYRYRSAGNVLKEIRHLVDTYGIKELLFEDDNLTLNKPRAIEIFDGMVKQGFNLVWRTPNGIAVSTLDEKLLLKMKESGCYQLGIPVESGSQRVLNEIIKKPVLLTNLPRIVKFARKIGIDIVLFLIVGMPGETIEEMKKTFRFSRSLGIFDKQHISIATPYPGSELYDICLKNGYFSKDFHFDRLSIRNVNIETGEWKKQDILDLIKRERRRNHLHCLFIDPILFLKAVIPENIKQAVKKHLKPKTCLTVYSNDR